MGIIKRWIERADTLKSAGEVGTTVWAFLSPYAAAWIATGLALLAGAMTWVATTTEWFWTTWGAFGAVLLFAGLLLTFSTIIGMTALLLSQANARAKRAQKKDGLSYDFILRDSIWYLIIYNDGQDTTVSANLDLRSLSGDWVSPGYVVSATWGVNKDACETLNLPRRRSVEMPLFQMQSAGSDTFTHVFYFHNGQFNIGRSQSWHYTMFNNGTAPRGRFKLTLFSSVKPKASYNMTVEFNGFVARITSSAIPLHPQPQELAA
jgi:hypothetical protein